MPLDTFTIAYIEAALQSSTLDPYGTCPACGKDNKVLCRWREYNECVCADCSDREPNCEPPADDNYSISELAPQTRARMIADCAKFQAENDLSEGTEERAGHDFWLTRCGHGCGFWDGDWPVTGDTLTAAAKAFGNVDLYVGDDGLIYSL